MHYSFCHQSLLNSRIRPLYLIESNLLPYSATIKYIDLLNWHQNFLKYLAYFHKCITIHMQIASVYPKDCQETFADCHVTSKNIKRCARKCCWFSHSNCHFCKPQQNDSWLFYGENSQSTEKAKSGSKGQSVGSSSYSHTLLSELICCIAGGSKHHGQTSQEAHETELSKLRLKSSGLGIRPRQ